MTPVIQLDHVSTHYLRGTPNEVKALDDINLSVRAGEFITIIGSNGAGKSTLIKTISGLSVPNKGRVLFQGTDFTRTPPHMRARAIGRIAQDPHDSTCAVMTIAENLAMAEKRGRPRGLQLAITSSKRKRYRDLLAPVALGLEARLDTRVGTLSGGQRQALALIMATLSGARLLLLDEHLAALDPKTADNVMQLTSRIVADRQLATLMITHNMHDAIRCGSRLLLMHGGRIVYDASGAEKNALTVPILVGKFHKLSEGQMTDDRVLLAP